MKNIITYLMVGVGLITTLSSCRQESLLLPENVTQYKLEVVGKNARNNTKADGSGLTFTFIDGDNIGVFIKENGAFIVNNRKATLSHTGEGYALWTLESDIIISSTEKWATGCFPYNPGTKVAEIPLTAGVYDANVNDVIYQQQVVAGTEAKYKLVLDQMQHVMTRLWIKLKRDNVGQQGAYPGKGEVTSFTIADHKAGGKLIYKDGFFDASNGSSSAPKIVPGTADSIKIDKNYTLTTTAEFVFDILLLPVADLKDKVVRFAIEVDGRRMVIPVPTVSTDAQSWLAGKAYTYEMTIKELGVEFVSVKASEWGVGGDVQQSNDAVKIGQYTSAGVVFWVDPMNAKHFKVISMDEPPLGDFTAAKDYVAAYGAGWRLPTADDVNFAPSYATIVDALTKINGMPLKTDNEYWGTDAGGNAASWAPATGALTAPATGTSYYIRGIKEVTLP